MFAHVGRIHNLKDLKDPKDLKVDLKDQITSVPGVAYAENEPR